MTVHFIEETANKLVLHDRILCTRDLHVDTKDGDYIRGKLLEYLQSYSLDSLINQFVFVSDRGSNIKKALEPFKSVHCFAHMVNNLINHMLKDHDLIMTAVKSLVKYFKVTGMNSVLDETLKSFVKTRWNSMYYMLKSVIANWDQINDILRAKGGLMRLANIDVEDLKVKKLMQFNIARFLFRWFNCLPLYIRSCANFWSFSKNAQKKLKRREDQWFTLLYRGSIGYRSIVSRPIVTILSSQTWRDAGHFICGRISKTKSQYIIKSHRYWVPRSKHSKCTVQQWNE